jgi:hypothetical protein
MSNPFSKLPSNLGKAGKVTTEFIDIPSSLLNERTSTHRPKSESGAHHEPQSTPGSKFADRALLFQFIYSILGLVLGSGCMLIGLVLFLHGVTGSTSWSATILGSGSKLTDAAPGTVIFVVGVFIVLITKYKVKVR